MPSREPLGIRRQTAFPKNQYSLCMSCTKRERRRKQEVLLLLPTSERRALSAEQTL